jgi:arylsulfatase A-like enzyme
MLRQENSMMKKLILGGLLLAGCVGAAQKPNVLLIIADDLGYQDLGCYGVKDFETPNIDRIAASGIRFTDGYVTAPQCGPSRAGLITGMSQSRFGVTDNKHDYGLPPREVVELLPEQMKAQGYTTGMVGKWHIGFRYHPDDRANSGARPGHEPWERGFDYVFKIFAGSAQYFPYKTPDFRAENGWIKHLQEKCEGSAEPVYLADLPKSTYMTDIFTERGVDFIKRHTEEPWFLYLSYTAPHGPMQPKADKFKKYEHIKNGTRRKFVAMMDSLDEGIGNVLDTLEQTGQLENTVVWFLSDNGGVAVDSKQWNGSRCDPFSGAKGDIFEGGIRIPFMVSWPGKLPQGKVVSDPVTALDILPTCLAVAGKDRVAAIHEGRNLLPWLEGARAYPAKDLFWTWRGEYHAVRMDTLKEIRNGRSVKSADGTEIPKHNFVDLASNPAELAGEHALQNPEQKQLLSKRLDAWLAQVKQDAEKLTPPGEY